MIYGQNFNNSNNWDNYLNWFNQTEVQEAINGLNVRKNPGPMGLYPETLKNNIEHLSPIITNTFKDVLLGGTVPDDWKSSLMYPIPKKGDQTEISNYRGLSIQFVIPKLIDKLLTKKLIHHIAHLIPKQQHGFMPNRGTLSNLMEMTHFLHCNMSTESRVDVIYLDFSKAFDKISHQKIDIAWYTMIPL